MPVYCVNIFFREGQRWRGGGGDRVILAGDVGRQRREGE